MDRDAINEAGLPKYLSEKCQILFEVPANSLIKQTNMKLKKMINIILMQSENRDTLIANGLMEETLRPPE